MALLLTSVRMVDSTVLEPFIYVVSGVLKLWHLLIHNVLGVNDSTAWAFALLGLVVTVRGLITPISWIQYMSSRRSIVMRPELAALNKEYETRTDKESVAELETKRKELRQRHNYNPLAGCLPMLIQIPIFFGLYRVVVQMSRPSETLEVPDGASVGLLNATEMRSFINAELFGYPLPAYVAMSEEHLAALGTTRDEVLQFVLPTLLLAVFFTMFNLFQTVRRNRLTMDWTSKISRVANKIILFMIPFIPIMLISFGLTGQAPVAIIAYWFANNLWTLAQTTLIRIRVDQLMPLSEEHQASTNEAKEAFLTELRERRTYRRGVRRRQALGAIQPWRIPEIRRELNAEKAERREKSAAEKAERKRIRKEQSAARTQLIKDKNERKRQERLAKKNGETTAKSSSPPEEPAASDEPGPEQSPKD